MPFDVADAFRELGFRCAPAAISALLEDATKTKASPVQVLERLAKLERRERDARNLARRTRIATLGPMSALDSFNWNHPRSIDRALYDRLLGLDFLDDGGNVLLRGPSGVGKTTLAQNLALAALAAGRRVRFTTLAAALTISSSRSPSPRSTAGSGATSSPTFSCSTSSAICRATPAPPTCSTRS